MPVELLADTHDDFSDALTLGPSQQITSIQWQIASPNAARFQIAKLNKAGIPYWDEAILTAQPGIGGYSNCYGVRFKSFTPGLPTAVDAVAYFADDPIPNGFQGSSVANAFSTGGVSGPIAVSVSVSSVIIPTVRPIYIADPGPGVASIPLYDVPAKTLTQFLWITYQVNWDVTGGLGDRAVVYDIVDGNLMVPARFTWAQGGNVIYKEASHPTQWLETDANLGNFLRTIDSTIVEEPFDGGTDFEAANPFGDSTWPTGFALRLTVPHMAVTDEVSLIRLMVSEIAIP